MRIQMGLWLILLFVAFVQVWILCSRGKHPKDTRGYRRWLLRRKGKALFRLVCCVGLCALVAVGPEVAKGVGERIPFVEKAEAFVAEKVEPKAKQPDWLCYYNQTEEPWGSQTYGPVDLIADTGCGPTVLAMVVSTLSEEAVTPKEMADWAYENGYCSIGSGSFHTLIGEGLSSFGFSNHAAQTEEEVKEALQNHQLHCPHGRRPLHRQRPLYFALRYRRKRHRFCGGLQPQRKYGTTLALGNDIGRSKTKPCYRQRFLDCRNAGGTNGKRTLMGQE